MPAPIITLTTDFGTADGYVGAMVGVIAARCPDARIEHLTHAIPPQDVRAGAQALLNAAPWFPAGTIHVAVIDPGVGTARRGVALEAGAQRLIGPDNGLLLPLATHLGGVRAARELSSPEARLDVVSATFHGRDIFAPAAAALAAGWALERLGPPLDAAALENLPPLPLHREPDGALQGCVARVDRFGNLITNLPAASLPRRVRLSFPDRPDLPDLEGPHRTYGDVPEGTTALLIDSGGMLEIALRGGDAARALGLTRGATVRVRPSQVALASASPLPLS